MLDYIVLFIGVYLLIAVVEPAIFHRRNRDRLNQTCVKENPWKTYFDNVVTNLFVGIPLIATYYIIAVIVEVFSA